jgi:predicted nucleic acid-binding protein
MNPTNNIQQAILEELQRLSEVQQAHLLHFIQSMLPNNQPTSDLLRFAGAIDSGELQTMQSAIDTDCNKVDADEW